MHLTVYHTHTKILPRIGKKSPVENEHIKTIGTRPENREPFHQLEEIYKFTQTHLFSERKPDLNWKYCGKHYS